MTFTKKKLAAAMTGAVLASVSGQAVQAAVDLDVAATTAANPLLYASEIVIGTAGVGLTDTATQMDIVGTLTANQIPNDTDLRLTLTLSGGTFTAAPTMTIDDGAGGNGCDAGTAACPAVTVFTGGGTSDSTVTFDTNTGNQVVDAAAHFNVALNGLTVTGQSAITATVTIQIADNFGPTDLPGKSGSYLSFSPLLSVTADSSGASGENIDVTQNSTFFSTATGDNSTNVGGALLAEDTTAPVPVGVTTGAINTTSIVAAAQNTITAANGFAAFNQTGGGITIGGAAGTFSTADSTKATGATYAPAAGGDTAGSRDVVLTVPTANSTIIAETTLTDAIAVTGAATATYSTSTATGEVNLQSLARNGSSARLTFSLTPNGNYPMFIRVTNPSSIAGPVTLTLTNDDGDTSSAIDISTLTGSAELAAGASTGLLNINDVFAAVQAADSTFDLGATNKLRVSVSAEFGTTGANSGVVLGAFSVSSDGTTFNMMTDASN